MMSEDGRWLCCGDNDMTMMMSDDMNLKWNEIKNMLMTAKNIRFIPCGSVRWVGVDWAADWLTWLAVI